MAPSFATYSYKNINHNPKVVFFESRKLRDNFLSNTKHPKRKHFEAVTAVVAKTYDKVAYAVRWQPEKKYINIRWQDKPQKI